MEAPSLLAANSRPSRVPLSKRRAWPQLQLNSLSGTASAATSSWQLQLDADARLLGSVNEHDAANHQRARLDSAADAPLGFEDTMEMGVALGSGTVAVVRLATRKSDGRQIAVKCVRSVDEELRQFTRAEHELVRSLDHPAIVKFEEKLWESDTKLYICMEYCSDGSIELHASRHGQFSVDATRDLGTQLLKGVNHLHHKRVVHRDLKPANLLLTRDASVLKVTDFNSAKRIGRHLSSSLMLTDRGTRMFSAPELRFGRLWNERIDVWACGLVLFFMLRVALPFDICEPRAAEVLCKGGLPDVEWSELDESMAGLIKQCLVVDVHARPAAVSLLLHPALRILRRQAPSTASPDCGRPILTRRPSDGETVDKFRAEQLRASTLGHQGDVFSLLPSCGLVGIHSSKPRAKRLSPPPLNLDFTLPLNNGYDVHQSGASTCYLPDVVLGTPTCSTSPDRVGRKSAFSWTEPRRFDAMLKSAVQNFEKGDAA